MSAVSDQPRPDAALALKTLTQAAVARNLILTDDHERIARAVAEQVDADELRTGPRPDENVPKIKYLMNNANLSR
jgi:cation transport ATPase